LTKDNCLYFKVYNIKILKWNLIINLSIHISYAIFEPLAEFFPENDILKHK
jgi:hypothetical protein